MANVSYAIRDLAVAADQVAREGHQILYLNIGDPCKFDFPTPPHMIEAVLKAMVDGHNGYGESLGIKPAIEAIHREAERNGFRDIQSIFIGYGRLEVIDSCLTALAEFGDNVLTPSPEYPLYGAIMAKLDCPANAYDLDERNGWEPDVADIERKINARTKAILLITPNNPTGAVYSKRTLECRHTRPGGAVSGGRPLGERHASAARGQLCQRQGHRDHLRPGGDPGPGFTFARLGFSRALIAGTGAVTERAGS